ncbi:MAG: efflux RND transporter permease subunit [Spirochaetia bacterium]|jgi:multidrug efflux pump subunit AcrB|nr:efflux RND transporter permease subunit [Spirochaetia bacterium]
MNLPKFSTENTVLLSIVLVTVLVLGGFSVARMPQEQFSEVPFFWANIIVPYPGASSSDIEQSVTVKVEREMQGLKNLKQVQSVTSDGLAVIRVEFDDGISNDEFERLFQDVRTRLGKVGLPDGALQPLVDDFSSNDFLPVIEVVISGEIPYGDLVATARSYRNGILLLKDVSSVDIVGDRDRRIVIDADRDKLESLGIPISELLRAVQLRNLAIPGGTLETVSREYLLRTVGSLEGIGEFENVIVRRTDSGGGLVRVGDLARVYEDYERDGETSRFNGETAVILRVGKIARGDSIGVIDQVKALIAEQSSSLIPGTSVSLVNDSTVQIRDSIDVLLINAVQGLVLLFLILLLFLGARNALMTALGIPVTFAVTFLILEALGETINSNTLFGLVLVLGLIVDHAIVITENTYRLRTLGYDKKRAAIEGASQVAWPIVASSLTTVAAFLPLMILPGTIGKFLRVIPLVVSISLIASTIEAILFIPAHSVEWPGGDLLKTKPDIFDKIKPSFDRFIRSLYKKRLIVVLGFIVVAAGIFSTIPFLKQDLFSAEDFTLFFIDIDLPAGSNSAKTESVVRRFEDRIQSLRGNGEVSNIISSVGFRSGGSGGTSAGNVGQIVVDLAEVKEGRERPIAVIMDEVMALCADIPGPEKVIYRKAASGPPVSPPVGFRVRGDDYGALIEATAGIKARLSEYPELLNIEDTLQSGTPELRVRINEERAASYGLSVSSVGTFLRGSYDGYRAGSVFFGNEELDIVVRYAGTSGLDSINRLLEIKIPTPDGRLVPFSAVAELQEGAALAAIKRVDGKREVGVSAEAYDKSGVRAINDDIKVWFATEIQPRYPGLELLVGGEFAEIADLLIQILRVFLLGVFLIYAVLGAQFKSFTQPLLILLSVPMAFAGVVLFLVISGTPFSTTVLYAGVALAGIAVNDSIVLIDFINIRRKEGLAIADAVAEAASTRLRPILLTSVTTIGGLLPTAIGLGGYSVVWSPMASTIIFGLLFSTVTAISVVPSLYGLLYDSDRTGTRGKPRKAIA